MRSQRMWAKFSKCFLFPVVCFLSVFSPVVSQAQNNTPQCEWKWVWVQEWVWEQRYNSVTNRFEPQQVDKNVQRLRYVCQPASVAPDTVNNQVAKVLAESISQKVLEGEFAYYAQKEKNRIRKDLTGNWNGTYTCAQGLTRVNLLIFQSNSSEINAVFKFYAHESNPSVPSGSFLMEGTYDSKTKEIKLKATDWINQPSGYVASDLVGTVSQVNTKISGGILSSSCSTFTIKRR